MIRTRTAGIAVAIGVGVLAPTMAMAADAATIVWDQNGSPYILSSDFVVGSGEVLRILPGVVVRLDPEVSLRIDGGRLEAVGTESDSILFIPNQPGQRWGALRCDSSWNNVLSHVRFEGGSHADTTSTEYGGMLELYHVSSLEMTHCVFKNGDRGAFFSRFGCQFTISDCVFQAIGKGGIVSITGSTGSVYRCKISNTGEDGIDFSGTQEPSHAWIVGNVIHGSADDGIDTDYGFTGSIAGNMVWQCLDKGLSLSTESAVEVYNNIVFDCHTGVTAHAGAFINMANVTIFDCRYGLLVTQDEPGYPPPVAVAKNVVAWGCQIASVHVQDGTSLTATYSDFEEAFPGEGNISADPLFTDPAHGDFHLQAFSPCIDSGTSDWPAPASDFDGNPRVDDPDVPNSGGGIIPHYDMGAYEYVFGLLAVRPQSAPTPGLVLRPLVNPASSVLGVEITLDQPGSVSLGVFDVRGRLIQDLGTRLLPAGPHRATFASRDEHNRRMAPGIYFVRAVVTGGNTSAKVVIN